MTRKWLLGVLMLLAGLTLIGASVLMPGATEASTLSSDEPEQLIRLHVVANSDSEEDQALKRAVRDAILTEITPLFADLSSKEEATILVEGYLPRIEQIAYETLAGYGVYYPVKAELGRFSFPAKAYGNILLPAGEYDALRVTLGQAEGANWWCIFFPPLCLWDWRVGIVQEAIPGTGGTETMTVTRAEAPALVAEEDLQQAEVHPRFAILEWARGLLSPESKE